MTDPTTDTQPEPTTQVRSFVLNEREKQLASALEYLIEERVAVLVEGIDNALAELNENVYKSLREMNEDSYKSYAPLNGVNAALDTIQKNWRARFDDLAAQTNSALEGRTKLAVDAAQRKTSVELDGIRARLDAREALDVVSIAASLANASGGRTERPVTARRVVRDEHGELLGVVDVDPEDLDGDAA